jgi:ABC-type glycerol-3-phosphate transport system substrate-binding protein
MSRSEERIMTRAAAVFGIALALAACGRDEKPEAAKPAGSATEVTVDSAKRQGESADRGSDEKTKATVESAVPDEKPTEK